MWFFILTFPLPGNVGNHKMLKILLFKRQFCELLLGFSFRKSLQKSSNVRSPEQHVKRLKIHLKISVWFYCLEVIVFHLAQRYFYPPIPTHCLKSLSDSDNCFKESIYSYIKVSLKFESTAWALTSCYCWYSTKGESSNHGSSVMWMQM